MNQYWQEIKAAFALIQSDRVILFTFPDRQIITMHYRIRAVVA